jgi:hypothetical protein
LSIHDAHVEVAGGAGPGTCHGEQAAQCDFVGKKPDLDREPRRRSDPTIGWKAGRARIMSHAF